MQLLKIILKIYELDILSATFDNIEIAITLDSSKLKYNLFHINPGLKVVYC